MLRIALATFLFSTAAALAEVPRVVTDILPVQGLVAGVMDGLGAPASILPPGADPHGHSLRPSDAAALENADLVIWIGDALTPWLAKPIETLAGNASRLELLEVEGTHLIEIGDVDTHDDGHGHDGHGHDAHAHSGVDPHAWLDPDNALIWLDAIARTLSDADPENSARYRANAETAAMAIRAEIEKTRERLSGLADIPYAVQHDAYRYFEARFGLSHAFSVVPADGREPGPRRIAELRKIARDAEIVRLVADPGRGAEDLAGVLFDPRPAKVCSLDQMGAGLAPDIGYYQAFLARMSIDMASCLKP